MHDHFKIYVLRLTEGRTEKINEEFAPDFLDISEAELSFKSPIFVKGEASLADQALILRLNISTEVTMPCAICNRDVQVKIRMPDFCHTVELSEIKGSVFDYSNLLRESILLEIPLRAECLGKCPEREALSSFFASRKRGGDEEFHPFEDL